MPQQCWSYRSHGILQKQCDFNRHVLIFEWHLHFCGLFISNMVHQRRDVTTGSVCCQSLVFELWYIHPSNPSPPTPPSQTPPLPRTTPPHPLLPSVFTVDNKIKMEADIFSWICRASASLENRCVVRSARCAIIIHKKKMEKVKSPPSLPSPDTRGKDLRLSCWAPGGGDGRQG